MGNNITHVGSIPVGTTVPIAGAVSVDPKSDPWQAALSTSVIADTVVQASAGAGVRNYLSTLILSNSSATALLASIKDGAVVVAQVWLPAGATVSESFPVPIRGSAATALNVALGAAAGPVYVTAVGHRGV